MAGQDDPHCFYVEFDVEPYTFVSVPHFCEVWNAPMRKSPVVYLWCIEYERNYLVDYVGKTSDSRGFDYRLWPELCSWRNGECPRVNVEEFKRGRRVEIASCDQDQLTHELRELEPLYRILIARMSEQYCRRVENEIAHRLQRNPATCQFLCNKNSYPNDPAMQIPPSRNPRIIGITVPVPESLDA
jgi:hypothetical protein